MYARSIERLSKQRPHTDTSGKVAPPARAEPAARSVNGRAGNSSNGETKLSPYALALESSGLSRQTANRYQALADVARRDVQAKPAAVGEPVGLCSCERLINPFGA